ncbi:MAG TPA: sulfurtransferase [Thermoanaerobaculaceae bacterium]|nr:sulfurtransferase [Thermoanaerobaculaceae bacterium]HPS77221.1 sulfurtransferase [Thermoanaerobaculaceae bacterium]
MVTNPAPDVVVDTLWLATHLDAPNLRIVECDADSRLYDHGHIPGAVRLDCQADLVDLASRDLVSRDELEALAGRLGIGNGTDVVFYGDEHNILACHAYWVFRLFGHTRMKILNGGRTRWIADGQRLVRDVPRVAVSRYMSIDRTQEFRALREDVLRHIGWPDPRFPRVNLIGRALVDDRSPAEYEGQFRPDGEYPARFRRSGHIPGACNLPWRELVRADGTFRTTEEIKRVLVRKGLTPEKDIVVYTRIGERSSLVWFVLHELLGFPKVRNYDGSWTEWGNMVGMPIESSALVRIPPNTARPRSVEPILRASA